MGRDDQRREHGNMFPGVEGEQKLTDAYVWSDSF
jgi:hypothetical protein